MENIDNIVNFTVMEKDFPKPCVCNKFQTTSQNLPQDTISVNPIGKIQWGFREIFVKCKFLLIIS